MEIEWTSKSAVASNVESNCSDDDRVDGENGMAISHRLAARVVSLLYIYVGSTIFLFQKHMSLQMTVRVNGLEPLQQAEINITTCINCTHSHLLHLEMTAIGIFVCL